LNIPRDFLYGENKHSIRTPKPVTHGAGSDASLSQAADLIRNAKNPVILAGGGVSMGNAYAEVQALAEYLGAPVACTYLHNDSFPSDHPLACGPLGYQGHQSAMHAMSEADVVIALGSRLSIFGTLPQYEFDYFPKGAKVIQVDIDQRRLGLSKDVDCLVHGDCKQAAAAMLKRIQDAGDAVCLADKDARVNHVGELKANWEKKLDEWTNLPSEEALAAGLMKPRAMLREVEKSLPDNAMVSTDIGNICSVSNSYLRFKGTEPSFFGAMTFGNCGYAFPAAIGAKVAKPDRPSYAFVGDGAWGMSLNEVITCVREKIPTTAIVFRNGQWGAEKKNQVLWFGDRYIGTQLEGEHSFAEIAKSMGAEGIVVSKVEDVQAAVRQATKN
jgi:sulfoacetaldehyde acetyltransferase